MDIKDIKSLIKLVTETDVTEFALEQGDEKISIKRGGAGPAVVYQAPQPIAISQPASQVVPVASPEVPAAASPAKAAASSRGEAVTSPIVGTFYRAPAPDAAPYVEVGQVVEKGGVFCIVEAMKLMNEIEAEFRCKILEICKENAQPVEYGDTLFIVERL